MASIKLNNYEIFSQSGDAAPKLNNSTGLNFSTTNQNFTIKGIDAPIVGATNSTEDNPNSGQLAIYNGDTKLWGINESGWVQNPNIPYFRVTGNSSSHSFTTPSDYNVIPFNTIQYNNGNHYDSSNYKFTAPIGGLYYIFFNCHMARGESYGDAGGNDSQIGIFVNGSVENYDYGTTWRGYYAYRYFHTTVELNAGDYINAYVRQITTTYNLRTNMSNFSGFLIG